MVAMAVARVAAPLNSDALLGGDSSVRTSPADGVPRPETKPWKRYHARRVTAFKYPRRPRTKGISWKR